MYIVNITQYTYNIYHRIYTPCKDKHMTHMCIYTHMHVYIHTV